MACADCHLYQMMNDQFYAHMLEREKLLTETFLLAIARRDQEIAMLKNKKNGHTK